MAYNPNILDTSAPQMKQLDIATPVNMYNSIKSARAQQRLQDLTLSQAEKKVKRQEQYKNIMSNSLNEKGQINSEQAISNLNQAGLFEESQAIQNRMQTAFENKQKLKSEMDLKKGKMFEAVLSSENPVEAFMIAREDAVKNGIELSPGLMNYEPTFFETQDRRLDEKVATELDYLSKKAVAKKGPMSLEDKLFEMRERYNEKKKLEETKSKIKVEQPLTESEKSRERIAERGAKVKEKKLGMEEQKEEREIEKWEIDKKNSLAKHQKIKLQSANELAEIQEFSDLANEIAADDNLKYITGLGKLGRHAWGSPAADLFSDLERLLGMGTIQIMAKLKKESPTGSTGFGALSQKELDVLQSAFSSIRNNNQSAKKKAKELKRISDTMNNYLARIRKFEKNNMADMPQEKTEEENVRDIFKKKK